MARISGVNIPTNKQINIALTYIFGIGRKRASDICIKASIYQSNRVNHLNVVLFTKLLDFVESRFSVVFDLLRDISIRS